MTVPQRRLCGNSLKSCHVRRASGVIAFQKKNAAEQSAANPISHPATWGSPILPLESSTMTILLGATL
jgi:hypothetical protein